MRAACLAVAIAASAVTGPLLAQSHDHHTKADGKPAPDHSGHPAPDENLIEAAGPGAHAGHVSIKPEPEPLSAEPLVDHSAMDHSRMSHSQKENGEPAQDHSNMDHGSPASQTVDHAAMGHAMPTAPAANVGPPPRALQGPRFAADDIWGAEVMAPARRQLARENGKMITGMVLAERAEIRFPTDGDDAAFLWDVQGWYGGDINRLFIKSEGEGAFGGGVDDAEVQLLLSRAITPFFDLQAGARLDIEPEARSHLVLGVQGIAPYWFHIDAAAFLSDRGDLTARLEAEYDQKLTQRLILQPRAEVELSAQDIAEREIGAGFTKIETGLRLRYEIRPEFAPYIGIGYERLLGDTADIARINGEDTGGTSFLFGLRAWF